MHLLIKLHKDLQPLGAVVVGSKAVRVVRAVAGGRALLPTVGSIRMHNHELAKDWSAD